MTKDEIKKKLIELNLVIDNDDLQSYLNLIEKNIDNHYSRKLKKELLINTHHIIPKYYYKENKLEVDNSKNNLVQLPYREHILLHYYLYKCSSCAKYSYYNLLSLQMLATKKKNYHLTTSVEEIINSVDKFEDLEREQRRLDSIMFSNQKNPMYGRKHSLETRKLISQKRAEYNKTHENVMSIKENRDKVSKSLINHEVSQMCREKISRTIKNIVVIHKNQDELRIDKQYLNEFLNLDYELGIAKREVKEVVKSKTSRCARVWVRYKDMIKVINKNLLEAYLRAGFIQVKRIKRSKIVC